MTGKMKGPARVGAVEEGQLTGLRRLSRHRSLHGAPRCVGMLGVVGRVRSLLPSWDP